MEFKNTINGTIVIIVAVCLICGMLVPIIDGIASGEPGQTNEGAGWIRMNYDTSASTYTISLTPTGDGVSVTNGTDTQTGSDETILYADSNVAVWIQDSAVNVLGQNTDGPQFLQPEDTVTITRTAEGVTIVSGEDSLSFATPDWAYIPISSGNYGFFEDGTAVATNSPIAAVGGGFAGVYAYNDITRYAGLGLQLQTVIEDDKVTGTYWDKTVAADTLSTMEPFDPNSITFDPSIINLDPISLGGGSSVGLMAVPTPTYTDGDWGYNLQYIGGVQKAIIVSYSGTGGDIVVPATVGGYDVHRVGLNAPSSTSGNNPTVFDNSTLSDNSTLTISPGIVEIGGYAFYRISKLTEVVIPDSITAIGALSFYNCSGLTGELIIPDSVTTIYSSAFYECTGLTKLILSDSLVDMPNNGFNGCTGLTGELVIPDSVTTIKSASFSRCSGLTSIKFPESLTAIEDSAFGSCTGLTGELVIPDSVVTIGKNAFYGCSSITGVKFSKSLITIGEYAFGNCTGLTGDVIFPDSVTTIGKNVFSNDSALTGTVVIPDSVTSIGEYSLYNNQFTKSVLAFDGDTTVRGNSWNVGWKVTECLNLTGLNITPGSFGVLSSGVVSDSIGDSIGYISFVETEGSGVEIPDSIKALMFAIPVVILASLLVAIAIMAFKRDY